MWEASSSPEPGGGPEEGEEAGGERSTERPRSKEPRASAGPGREEAMWVSLACVCVCVWESRRRPADQRVTLQTGITAGSFVQAAQHKGVVAVRGRNK